MRKGFRSAFYVVLAVLLGGKATGVVEGFFLSPGWLAVCVALPAGALALVYLVVQAIRTLMSRGSAKFWSRPTAVAVLLVLWGAPIVPGNLPRLAGYYLRVKCFADVPAILAWADEYRTTTDETSSRPITEWDFVQILPLPAEIKAMGSRLYVRTTDHAVMIENGGGLTGCWGLTVGHGIANSPEGQRAWRINDDAFVSDCE